MVISRSDFALFLIYSYYNKGKNNTSPFSLLIDVRGEGHCRHVIYVIRIRFSIA